MVKREPVEDWGGEEQGLGGEERTCRDWGGEEQGLGGEERTCRGLGW